MAITQKNMVSSLNSNSRILVTGGAGFIGSALIHELNRLGFYEIDICDELGESSKWLNLRNLIFKSYIELSEFNEVLNSEYALNYDAIFHMGGMAATENNLSKLMNNEVRFTFRLLNKFIQNPKLGRFINASTAQIYNYGSIPFSDDEKFINDYKPDNKLAYAKYIAERDLCVSNAFQNYNIVSLRYSNIFGANEYHKDANNISNINKIFQGITKPQQIINCSKFETNDYLYIKDAVKMTLFFVQEGIKETGIYNICSGNSFSNDYIAQLIYQKCQEKNIDVVIKHPMFEFHDKKECYLDNQKIFHIGYKNSLYSFEDAVSEYLDYLKDNKYLGD